MFSTTTKPTTIWTLWQYSERKKEIQIWMKETMKKHKTRGSQKQEAGER
jgi:hypothetical protein